MKKQIIYLLFVLFAFSWHSEAQVTSFPWSEDFEGTFLPSGWVKEIPDASNDITQSDTQNNTAGGQYSARFSSYNSSNDYNQYLFSEQIHVTAPYTQLTFWHRKSNTSSDELEWGISTTGQSSPDVASWTAVTLSDSAWQKETIDLSSYDGQDIYVAWHYFGDYLYYVYLDDVMIDEPPSCPEPSSLSASNITDSQAELSWTENGSASVYNIELGATGFAPTGNPTNSGVANPFTVTGLSSNTTYDYYVQADCGATGGSGTSSWVGPYTFTTDCSVYTPDYTQDFATFVPDCWDEANSGDATSGPGDIGASPWLDSSALGTGSARINLYSTFHSDWLLSPEFDLSAGGYEVVVEVAVTNWNNGDPDAMGSDDEVQLLYTEDGTNWTNITTWTAVDNLPNTPTQFSFNLTSTGSNVQFGILATDGPTDDDEDYDFHVADFKVRTPPACPDPSALDATNITASQAELSWTENGSASVYNIELGATGFAPTGTATNSGVANPFTVTGLNDSTTYDYYVQADCGGGSTSNWVGPYTFSTPDSCPPPSAGTTSNITSDAAELGWTPEGTENSWIIEYGEAGFTQGNGTSVNTSNNPYLVSGLTPHTEYEWYVKADCSNGDVSNTWAGPYSFMTACLTTSSFPYNYGFENVTSNTGGDWTASCWSGNPENTGSSSYSPPYRWTPNDAGTPSGNTGPSAANSGTMYAYTEASGSATGDVAELISPIFDMSSLTQPQLTFYYHMYGADMGTLHVDTYDGTNWTNDAWSITGQQQTSDTDPWLQGIVSIPNTTTQIRFRAERGSDYTSDMAVDDITIDEAPACPAPSGLSASNITDSQAQLSWTENGSASVYNIELGATGFNPTGNPTNGGVANPFTVTGLSAATTYDYYVQADCGGGSTSAWAGPYTFTTACATMMVPWTEGFEAGFDFSCWTNEGTSSYVWETNDGSSHGPGNTSEGTQAIMFDVYYAQRGETATATTPTFDMTSLTNPQLSFDYWMDGGADSDLWLKVEMTTNNGGSWTEVFYQEQDGSISNWTSVALPLSGTNASTQFRFIASSDYGSYNIFVDNLVIDEGPTCPNPSALTASNITISQADLSWTAGGSESMWNIEFGAAGFAPTGTPTNAGVSNPFTITGLTASTSYDYYVQADCGGGDSSDWVGPYTFATPPVNDDCSSAILLHIGCSGSAVEGTNVGATDSGVASPSCANYQGGDVWFQVEVPQTGALLIDSHSGGMTDGGMAVYTGDCGNLTEVDCNDDGGTGLMPQLDLSGLTPGSMIYIRFWEYGNNNFGTFTIDVSESGTCSGAITPDYTQTFNNFLPGCWEKGRGAMGSMYLHNSAWVCDGFGNVGTSGAARITIGALDKDEWLITPSFDLSAGNYELSFKVGVSHMTSNSAWSLGADETVQLVVSTDGGTTWSAIQSWGQSNSPSLAGDLVVVNVDNYTQNDVKFAFYMHAGDVYDGFKNFYVDDFNIKSVACFAPTDLYVNTMQPVGSVEFSWTDHNSGNSDYTLYWGEVGNGLPNSVSVSGTSYQLTGLTMGIDYEWAVMADCGSDTVYGANFNLGCSYYVPDYLQEFDDYLPTCWEEARGTSASLSYQNSLWTSDGFGNVGTTGAARIMIGSKNKDEWLVSPSFDLSGGDYTLSFDVGLSHMSQNLAWGFGADESVQLMVSTDGGDTWMDLMTWDQGNTPSLSGDNTMVDISSYLTTDVKFAFYMHEGDTYDGFRNFYVDNFHIYSVGPSFRTIANTSVHQSVDANVREVDSNLFSVASEDETNISSIKVYDLSGRLIYRNDQVNSTVYQVQFNGISGNIYIFQIGMNNDTEKVVRKVLKK